MVDPDGVEWLRYAEASDRVGVPVTTLKVWVHRRKVRTERVGRATWLHLGDVRHAEAASYTRQQRAQSVVV